jgi:hypothetical protein
MGTKGWARQRPIFLREEDSMLVAVAVMIVVIPIALGMPAMCVFIPPSTIGVPAALPRFVQFMTPAFGLLAPVAMMLNGFVQPVVRARNAALAIVAIGAQTWHSGEH